MRNYQRRSGKDHRLQVAPDRVGSQCGITLIELMIVVAIVGILGAIAYPSYQQYVIRSARSDARAALLDAASRQEQFYLDNKQYTPTLGAGGLNLAATTEGGYYTIAIAAANAACPLATCYSLTATPVAGKPSANDATCGTLSLGSNGVKSATGTMPNECW